MSTASKTALRMVLMLIVVGLIFGGVFGYGAVRSIFIAKFLAGFSSQAQTVATTVAATSNWQPALSSVGSVVAVNGANLSAEVAGIVDTISFKSGDDVPAGALLVTLRPNNDPAVLAQLQATAALDEINYQRDVKQFRANAIAQSQVDTDRANLQAAQAQVQAQQALMVEKHIRAPFAGRLGIRQVDVGQYLPVGTAIVTLQQLNPLYVDFYLPQQALSQLQVGQTVNVGIDAFPGQTFPAKIAALDAVVDTTSRSVQVRATLPNDNLLLRPGMFATVKVNVGAPQELVTLPQTALTYNPYGTTVYTVQHQTDPNGKPALTAQQAFVTTGDTRGDQVAVLTGVAPGAEVVTAGQLKLRNGSPVVVNNDVTPPNSPDPTPPNE
ncbi:efflux RND transporter periplasmic adaptor subunit [Acidocella sp.]|jgi:membrane fusion protein (multidrug efflux system)|uniref:efflux RND transporter periplasmic adaptor subunit n=1 Tax=Acidocella sp. TaxID=50710 RepID=UPI002F423871